MHLIYVAKYNYYRYGIQLLPVWNTIITAIIEQKALFIAQEQNVNNVNGYIILQQKMQ